MRSAKLSPEQIGTERLVTQVNVRRFGCGYLSGWLYGVWRGRRVQGAAMGLLFTPLQVLAFVTLAQSMRTEGATLFSLLRNLGAAIGVSVATTVLAHNTQVMHEMIDASVTPFNRALQAVGPVHQWLDPATGQGAAWLGRLVNPQAQIVAYADVYLLLIMTTLPAWLLLLTMRIPRKVINTAAE
jgi:DHA2 family multidrug resistance protein